MNFKTLDEIGILYGTDKASNHHKYLDHYGNIFSNLRDENVKILEIGVLFGQSLSMLSNFFPNGEIFAFDIEDKRDLIKDRVNILVGDQSDRKFLDSFEDDYFDIILDDGSHRMDHQQISFGSLFRKLKSKGIYIIEDLHTSDPKYFETLKYGNQKFHLNHDSSNTTIKFLEGLLGDHGPNYYLTTEEYLYLKSNISNIQIIETAFRSENDRSITSFILKK